jgi:hypothetical protein
LFGRILRLDFHPDVIRDGFRGRRVQRMLMIAGLGAFLHFVFVFEMSHQSLELPG